jgi:hypothetical protein
MRDILLSNPLLYLAVLYVAALLLLLAVWPAGPHSPEEEGSPACREDTFNDFGAGIPAAKIKSCHS